MKQTRKNSGTSEIDVSSPFIIRKTIVVVDSQATGAALKQLRKTHGVSARKVANFLGMSSMRMSYYENGKRSIKSDVARDIVTAIHSLAKVRLSPSFNLTVEG